MTDAELLAKIKNGLGITGSFQDETLRVFIDDTKEFLISAGVKASVVNSAASVGCILQGVTDKWVEKRGDYSESFKKRLIQLTFKPEIPPNETNGNAGGENSAV